MATITLRETKGSPLSFVEMDANLTNLNNDKQEVIPNLATVDSIDATTDKLLFYDVSSGAARAILPQDVLAFVNRTLMVKCVADGIGPSVGNGITHVTIPSTLNGKNLLSVEAHVYTAGSSGSLTNIQIHNLTKGLDILSTPITIDLNEKDSSTAATPVVIGGDNNVSTGDVLRIDVDAVSTGTLGLEIRMVFTSP
jgi:hypothetical protein|tara:strand:+ start:1535 stop:2122 length:588 start_codon:yes stop_codon:yes gene_type:complete